MAYGDSLYLSIVLCTEQGAHSPDARSVAMGVYPVQAIKSQILESDEVSEDFTVEKVVLDTFQSDYPLF